MALVGRRGPLPVEDAPTPKPTLQGLLNSAAGHCSRCCRAVLAGVLNKKKEHLREKERHDVMADGGVKEQTLALLRQEVRLFPAGLNVDEVPYPSPFARATLKF